MAARLTQIDYDREMAFLLLDGEELLGVGRLAADPGFEQAEFALIVASDRQRRGYGELLLRHVLAYASRAASSAWSAMCCARTAGCSSSAKRLGFAPKAGVRAMPTSRW